MAKKNKVKKNNSVEPNMEVKVKGTDTSMEEKSIENSINNNEDSKMGEPDAMGGLKESLEKSTDSDVKDDPVSEDVREVLDNSSDEKKENEKSSENSEHNTEDSHPLEEEPESKVTEKNPNELKKSETESEASETDGQDDEKYSRKSTHSKSLKQVALSTEPYDMDKEHEALQKIFGLDKPAEERGKFEKGKAPSKGRAVAIILIALVVISGCVYSFRWYQTELSRQEEARIVAKKELELAREEERRNRIEYADIAFLDSLPPAASISMDGKLLYARSQDGSYTELRARESTWIRNLPVKEDSIYHFSFSAEGFRDLTRNVAYYDWYPYNKPDGNPLQKVFRKIVLEPNVNPRVAECEQLPRIGDSDPCEWTVFREIVFRERYANAVKMLVPEEPKKREIVKQVLSNQPALAQSISGFDVSILDTAQPIENLALPDASRNLLTHLMDHPYGLYGAITIETDTPDTRVFFMSEPLMVIKESGSMSQVRVNPDQPYTFATYGQGRPVTITDTLSLRLEAPNMPAYIAEISPHQWHCDVPAIDQALTIPAPEFAEEIQSNDFRHYLCRYSVKISVKFNEIKALDDETKKAAHEQVNNK